MSSRPQAPTQEPHSAELHQVYERVLAGASVRSRHVEVAGNRVHLLEQGAGPPVVVVHGTGNPAGFLLPMLHGLHGVRAIAPDLPGVPTLPKTRCPLPIRVAATPGLGALLSRVAPPSPKSMLRFAGAMGEGATLARHPDLVDLLVAAGRDPITDRAARAEFRALVSPFALLSPSGFRRRARMRPDELGQVAVPTLVIWGDHDPVGSIRVARAVTDLIPQARLEVLPTGHGPWLGRPTRTAAAVLDFLR